MCVRLVLLQFHRALTWLELIVLPEFKGAGFQLELVAFCELTLISNKNIASGFN